MDGQAIPELRDPDISLAGGQSDVVGDSVPRLVSSLSYDEELGNISEQSSSSNGRVAGVRSIGVAVVLVCRCQVGWRGLQEVGKELGLRVLLFVDFTTLRDYCSIIVARVATRMSEVALTNVSKILKAQPLQHTQFVPP